MSLAIKCKPVQEAYDALQAAQKAMVTAVQVHYPVGTSWRVKLGGHILTLEVTGHGSAYWSSPGEIQGVNVKTGSVRSFHPFQVISEVEEESC